MISVSLFFYFGIFLAIVGSIATAWGPGVNDPIVRTFNTEIASIGVCLVLLCYNHVLALLTLLATTVIISLILFRAIIRLEEMGADVGGLEFYGINLQSLKTFHAYLHLALESY